MIDILTLVDASRANCFLLSSSWKVPKRWKRKSRQIKDITKRLWFRWLWFRCFDVQLHTWQNWQVMLLDVGKSRWYSQFEANPESRPNGSPCTQQMEIWSPWVPGGRYSTFPNVTWPDKDSTSECHRDDLSLPTYIRGPCTITSGTHCTIEIELLSKYRFEQHQHCFTFLHLPGCLNP